MAPSIDFSKFKQKPAKDPEVKEVETERISASTQSTTPEAGRISNPTPEISTSQLKGKKQSKRISAEISADKIAEMEARLAALEARQFPWGLLDLLLKNLLGREQFKMKSGGKTNNRTMWDILTALKDARDAMKAGGLNS